MTGLLIATLVTFIILCVIIVLFLVRLGDLLILAHHEGFFTYLKNKFTPTTNVYIFINWRE